MKNETKEILARVIELQAELDVRRDLYTELDLLTIQLKDENFKSAEIDGFIVTLVNNFEVNNTCFRPAGVKLWEVKIKKVK